MVAPGAFRREDHSRDVGKGPAVVVTKVVQVEDDGNLQHSRPPHQLEAGPMPIVGQQHVRPEPVKDLPGQPEKDLRLPRVGCPLARGWTPSA